MMKSILFIKRPHPLRSTPLLVWRIMSESFELFSNSGNADGGDDDDDDYEYERMTSSEVLEKLEEAWHNEKFAPDLLPHRMEFVASMLEQIRVIEESFEQNSKGDLLTSIQRLELDRIRYIICSYFRTRLSKIEKYVWHLLQQQDSSTDHVHQSPDPASQSLLSPQELEYAKEFSQNLEAHFQALVLKNVPSNLQQIDQKKAIPRPNTMKYVFIRGIKRKDNIAIDQSDSSPDAETITIEAGSQFILPYKPIAALIRDGDASLL